MSYNKKIYLMRPDVGEEELQAVKDVFNSKFLTEGEFTKKFENAFARYIGVKHAIATTSCSRAMELTLRVLGIGPGDEVIVPDFTHPATGNVVFLVGAKPVLVDIDLDTYNIDPDKVAKAITPRTKAIMPVSLFGNPLDMKPLRELKEKHNIYLIEDAACSAGAEVDSEKVGRQADVACFSFHPRKIITTGEGGMMITNDEEIAEKARSFKFFGFKTIDGVMTDVYRGSNFLFNNILGAIGLVQLSKIERIISSRIKKAEYYTKLFAGNDLVIPPTMRAGTRHTFQSYCIYLKKDAIRDRLKHFLMQKNIETQIGTYALHMQPSYKGIEHGKVENSELAYFNVLTLPLHHELTIEDQKRIIDLITDFLQRN